MRLNCLAIFVFYCLVLSPQMLQAECLPTRNKPVNFIDSLFLDEIILNIESFDLFSFFNKDFPEFINGFYSSIFLVNKQLTTSGNPLFKNGSKKIGNDTNKGDTNNTTCGEEVYVHLFLFVAIIYIAWLILDCIRLIVCLLCCKVYNFVEDIW